jgi:hypothetical protein
MLFQLGIQMLCLLESVRYAGITVHMIEMAFSFDDMAVEYDAATLMKKKQ